MTTRNDQLSSQDPVAINFIDVLRGMARRKLLVLGMGLLAFAGSAGLVKILKPVYSTEAQVLIQDLETPFDRVQPIENQRRDAVDDRVVASQISVLKSEDLGRRVVAALGLENEAEFNPLISGIGQVGRIRIALGFGTDPSLKTPVQRALDHYGEKLSVFQLPDSNVIGIKYSSSNPQMAAKVANTLADTYVMWTREAQSRPTERARDWLSANIDELRRKLAASEMAVEKFRAEAGLLQGATTTLGAQEISELNTQITVAKSASLEARAKADAIRDLLAARGSVDAATDVLASAAVQRLKEQRTEAARRRSELAVTYLSSHPKLIAVNSEIASIDKQIRAEALRVVASLDEQARIAESREKSLIASLGSLKAQETTANLDDVKLKALERESAADRILLEALLSRYAEASARQDLASQPGLGVIIQAAGVPSSPSFPKTGPMVLLITIAGLSFGLGFAFLLELMAAANRLTAGVAGEPERQQPALQPQPATMAEPAPPPALQPAPAVQADRVLQAVRQTVAAAAPASTPPQPFPAPAAPSSGHLTVWPKVTPEGDLSRVTETAEVAAAVRAMSGWADDVRRRFDIRLVGMTSIGGGTADAPVASLALARQLAAGGRRVVLVDLARMGAFLGSLCGVPQGPGLSDLVSGTAPFTKVMGRDTRSTVHVLRFGLDHSPQTSVLIIDRIESILAALLQSYDMIIVNLGEATEETPVFLHKCQGALLLAPSGHSGEAAAAEKTLMETGLTVARHVLIGPELTPSAAGLEVRREFANA